MSRTIIASAISSAVETHTTRGYVGIFSRTVLARLLLGLGSALVVATPLPVAYAQGDAVSFDQPKQIVGTPNQDAEPPQIAASGKNAYIIWHEFPEETATQPDVFFARSTNNG